jgi:predicted ATPase
VDRKYILTGAPGAGKTTLIEALKSKNYLIVNEAATDIIAQEQAVGIKEPWESEGFIDKIVNLQKTRQELVNNRKLVFFDRSPICTYALAIYLGFAPSKLLLAEIAKITKDQIYQKRVFLIENLGFITNTTARRINLKEALKFEKIHKEIYQDFGYELILIKKAPVANRLEQILKII